MRVKMQCPWKFVGAYTLGDGIGDARLSIDDGARKSLTVLGSVGQPITDTAWFRIQLLDILWLVCQWMDRFWMSHV